MRCAISAACRARGYRGMSLTSSWYQSLPVRKCRRDPRPVTWVPGASGCPSGSTTRYSPAGRVRRRARRGRAGHGQGRNRRTARHGTCHCQGAGAGDVVVPAGHGAVADAHDREVGVVAGPGAGVIDVEGVAVADRVPRPDLGVLRVVPGGLQIRGEPDDPVGADRLCAVGPSPAVVAVNAPWPAYTPSTTPPRESPGP